MPYYSISICFFDHRAHGGRRNIKSNASGGAASLDGYLYQVDISIWAALDLLLAKKLGERVVLEPASKEDLEAQLSEEQPGRFAATMNLSASKLLVVQAKLRNTGPWKVGEVASLLQHGTDRLSAADRLKDRQVHYVLVTSADVDGVARALRLTSFTERPKTFKLPATIAAVVPKDAAGRIGILSNADFERVQWKLRELLEDAFSVPHSRLEACRSALREAAIERMRGIGGGVWTREQIAQSIRDHDGYLATSLEAETFVRPTNWRDLKRALTENNVVVITGSSGTGKTTAANVLLGELRAEVAGITPIHILHGPEEVRATNQPGPVVFIIEDPWGKYRLEPRSAPWNDEVEKLLATASGSRRFIITSRSDVLAESHTKRLTKKWNVTLEAENYGPMERAKLFENRLPALPRPLQAAAARYRPEALNRLRSPLEMQKYFDNLATGRADDENERQYVERCLTEAHRDAIERTIAQQVDGKQAWPWAAVIWGLLKAYPKQSRALLADVQADIGSRDVNLEDGLDPFVNFMVNGRNLRQVESSISYYHPRVEAGLETGMSQKPGLSARVLGYLLDILIALNADEDDDWGLEGAANLARELRQQTSVRVSVSKVTQAALDAWITKRLAVPGEAFRNDLSLAAEVGPTSSSVAQVAKWLVTMSRGEFSFGARWEPEPDTDEWYEAMRGSAITEVICNNFVHYVLPFQNDGYPEDFADHIARLAPDLTPTFLEVASMTLSRGYDPNANAIAYGALKDLAGFEAILAEAVSFDEKLRAEDDPAKWLAISNGEYDEEYAEHLCETAGEDGYTSDVFIKAYVDEVAERRGWPALRDHPLLDGILYAWIDRVRKNPGKCEEPELLALAEKSVGHRHEDRFWSAAEPAWRDNLAPTLVKRMISGHHDRDVRRAAADCFARRAADSRKLLIGKLLASDSRRLVEIFLDLRGAWYREDERPHIRAFVEATLSEIPKEIADVASYLLEDPEPVPPLDVASLDFVRGLSPMGSSELALEKAKLLTAAGESASDLIEALVSSPKSDQSNDIGYAADALRLAVAGGLWSLIEGSLDHRFAEVRRVALEALAARMTSPLPPNILALATDKSSGVRRALVAILKERPAVEHFDALVTLADDSWSDRRSYYGQDTNYPIAQAACEVLAEFTPFPEHIIEPLIKIALETNDSDVCWDLIRAIAKNGGAKGRDRVCDIALSRENVKISTAAAWALYATAEEVEEDTAARLTTEQVTKRSAAVSVTAAMAIGACGRHDHVINTARILSALPKRRALIVPLLVGACKQDIALVEAVAKFLPPDREAVILDAFTNGTKLVRTAFDDLADVRIIEEILRRLSLLFLPKKDSQTVS